MPPPYPWKDRTGWAAVILLKLLGVSDADIQADFMASNTYICGTT